MKSLELTKPPVAHTAMLIRKPVSEVFEAIVDPAITSHFWFSLRGSSEKWTPTLSWTSRHATLPHRTTEELREPRSPWLPALAFSLRVLRYLCWFGLLEEGRPAANDDPSSPRLFRKTALYDRTLSFALT